MTNELTLIIELTEGAWSVKGTVRIKPTVLEARVGSWEMKAKGLGALSVSYDSGQLDKTKQKSLFWKRMEVERGRKLEGDSSD